MSQSHTGNQTQNLVEANLASYQLSNISHPHVSISRRKNKVIRAILWRDSLAEDKELGVACYLKVRLLERIHRACPFNSGETATCSYSHKSPVTFRHTNLSPYRPMGHDRSRSLEIIAFISPTYPALLGLPTPTCISSFLHLSQVLWWGLELMEYPVVPSDSGSAWSCMRPQSHSEHSGCEIGGCQTSPSPPMFQLREVERVFPCEKCIALVWCCE